MKDREYAALICAGYCSFYREGKKEEMHCGTFDFLRAHLTAAELRSIISLTGELARPAAPDFSRDDEIKTLICDACEFHIEGCDFREDRSGPPCGGYVIVEKLLHQLRSNRRTLISHMTSSAARERLQQLSKNFPPR